MSLLVFAYLLIVAPICVVHFVGLVACICEGTNENA